MAKRGENIHKRKDGRWEDGRKFEIDRLIHRCRAAATKVGGTGIRYTVSICGKQTYLFDEENGKWFVEFKTV